MTAKLFEDVACTLCGCVCDDLRLTVDGGRITAAERACALAEPWLLVQETAPIPHAEIGGQAASVEDALQQAAELLSSAQAPLVWGLSRSSTPGQRAALRLAEAIGATVDTTSSLSNSAAVMAMQQVGASTATLGEIRQRANLVIYWGVDPVVSHPRHLERLTVDPVGDFVARGRAGRTVVVVDSQPTATSALVDNFIRLHAGQNFEAFCTLRMLVRGIQPTAYSPTGLPLAALSKLAEQMKSCQSGVLFLGLGLSSGTDHRTVEAMLRLVTELNTYSRFYARTMNKIGGLNGAENVATWQTGFPFALNFARGYPRYNPGEFSATELLERGEVDACVLVGTEGIPHLSAAAIERLASLPTIALDYPHATPQLQPTIRFTTAVYGVHLPGTAYRMDEVPLPLQAVLPAKYLSDEQVLSELHQQIKLRATE